MIETGVLLDLKGNPLHWHMPHGRNGAALPDSNELWQIIWENRNNISGFAHSHPGFGNTGPSWTDLTTFRAIELGLGKRLDWFITSGDTLILLKWVGPNSHDYDQVTLTQQPEWVIKLRELSNYK